MGLGIVNYIEIEKQEKIIDNLQVNTKWTDTNKNQWMLQRFPAQGQICILRFCKLIHLKTNMAVCEQRPLHFDDGGILVSTDQMDSCSNTLQRFIGQPLFDPFFRWVKNFGQGVKGTGHQKHTQTHKLTHWIEILNITFFPNKCLLLSMSEVLNQTIFETNHVATYYRDNAPEQKTQGRLCAAF